MKKFLKILLIIVGIVFLIFAALICIGLFVDYDDHIENGRYTLRKYRPHDIFLQWNGDLWLQYMHKGIREDCVNEQQDLVDRIYEQNKPIPLQIEIKKFTDL